MTSSVEAKHEEKADRFLTWLLFDNLKSRDSFYEDRYIPRNQDGYTGWRSNWYFGRHREEDSASIITDEEMQSKLRKAILPDSEPGTPQ